MSIPNTDRFSGQYADAARGGNVDWPATRALAITPSDGADLTWITRAIYVGVSGDVKVDMGDKDTVSGQGVGIVFKAVPVGLLHIRARRVYATGTTATNLVALD